MTEVKNTPESKNEEILQTKGKPSVKRGLLVLAVVGIGMCVYGYRFGRGIGYSRGVKDGVIYTLHQAQQMLGEVAKEQTVS